MAKRGRPPFKPTPKQRRAVEQMVSVGESKATIARALRIDDDTLDKHFADELANGLARRRMEVSDLLFKSARKGNVSAQKHLDQRIGIAAAEAAFGGDKPAAPAEQPRPRKLGKKEEAQAAAETAGSGTDWGNDLNPAASRPN